MMRSLACLFLLLVLPWRAGAEELPTWSLRQLAIEADSVVLAQSLEATPLPTRFRILQVLCGRGLSRGDTLTLDYGEQYVRPGVPAPPARWKGPRVEQALFFLAPAAKGDAGQTRTPVASGLRLLVANGSVLAPVQQSSAGPYVLEAWSKVRWNAILRQTRDNVAAVERVRAAQRLVRAEGRNRELLGWIEQHRSEFGDGRLVRGEDEPQRGWGTLESKVFEWVLDGGRYDDSWLALGLHAELNRGDLPALRPAHFGTRSGRAFLLSRAVDEKNPVADRVRALKVLTDRATLGTMEKSAGEQGELIDRLVPLLAGPPLLRRSVVRAVGILSGVEGGPSLPLTRRAAPALVKVFRAEPPGDLRDELAGVLCVLAEPTQWRELTGYPPGLLVRIHDLERTRSKVRFWLSLHRGRYKVYECPTLSLERVEKNGKVAETKTMPLPVGMPVSWNEGWDGLTYLLVQLPLEGLKPGTWRISVTGTAAQDRDKVKWKVDPRTFEIPQPMPGGLEGSRPVPFGRSS